MVTVAGLVSVVTVVPWLWDGDAAGGWGYPASPGQADWVAAGQAGAASRLGTAAG